MNLKKGVNMNNLRVTKFICLSLILILFSTLFIHSQQNIAIGKKTFSSSNYSIDYPSANAVDGSLDTAWASQITNTPEWLLVDLGEIEKINGRIKDIQYLSL